MLEGLQYYVQRHAEHACLAAAVVWLSSSCRQLHGSVLLAGV
jgi:hypothetical protein